MNFKLRPMIRLCVVLIVGVWVTGCVTTPRVDWNSRVGVYTYDQAVIDQGPPDKMAKLSDGATVAEWMTNRGSYYGTPPAFGYYGSPYGSYGQYPGYLMSPPQILNKSPDTYLRLVFDPKGMLASWTDFLK